MQSKRKSLTIIGAGMGGLGCAWSLAKIKSTLDMVILEKSTKLGGRATSSSRNGFIYDSGANYFTFEGLQNESRIRDILLKHLPAQDCVLIEKDVHVFDENSLISCPVQKEQREKRTYRKGIMQLAELLQKDAEINVQFSHKVEKLAFDLKERTWTIGYSVGKDQKTLNSDFILLTPPAPQIADLLRNCEYPHVNDLLEIFSPCTYKKQLVLVIAFSEKIDLPYSALLNVDRKHDIAWVTVEDHKEGHVPTNSSLLVCQMSEAFSDINYDQPDEEVQSKIKQKLLALIPELALADAISHPLFSWLKRWRYSLPSTNPVNPQLLNQYQQDGLFFAGDFLLTKGRVLQAFESGIIIADLIKAKL